MGVRTPGYRCFCLLGPTGTSCSKTEPPPKLLLNQTSTFYFQDLKFREEVFLQLCLNIPFLPLILPDEAFNI